MIGKVPKEMEKTKSSDLPLLELEQEGSKYIDRLETFHNVVFRYLGQYIVKT